VEGIGSIKLQVQTTHGMKIVIVRNVFFVPGLKFNVFSDQSFVDDGFQFVSDKKGSNKVLRQTTVNNKCISDFYIRLNVDTA